MDKKNIRAHVVITGRVQGVFFRAETQRAAEGYGVFGWVKNRRDGSVEAVFEGDEIRVNAMLEWCKKGPPLARVTDVHMTMEHYTGEFKEFTITY